MLEPLADHQENRAHDRAVEQATARPHRWRRHVGDGVS